MVAIITASADISQLLAESDTLTLSELLRSLCERKAMGRWHHRANTDAHVASCALIAVGGKRTGSSTVCMRRCMASCGNNKLNKLN